MITQNEDGKGTAGERLIAQFFDSHYSKFFSFPDPKTRSNAQVADVLVWKNRVVFLIEVKTRVSGPASIDSWARSRIQEAVKQITTNYKRIKDNETINLHNSYYHMTLDCSGVSRVIGLIVLVYDGQCTYLPTSAVPDIYNCELPIHAISWYDLQQMTNEIDTVPDFNYYLTDRFHYLGIADIPLGLELNVLGYYKAQSNKFPKEPVDFGATPFWETYHSTMAEAIAGRTSHNEYSGWIDNLESVFSDQRKLFDGYPLGIYFAWEIGSISRRERAYLGEKLDSVQAWFKKGNLTRRFAWFNGSTGNWLVFYYSKSEPSLLHKELQRLVELKLIKEVHEASFKYGAYGFGLQVSVTFPPRLLGLARAIVISADAIKGKYSQTDLEEARKHFGDKDTRQIFKIEEFPED